MPVPGLDRFSTFHCAPDDFETFWERTVAELDSIGPDTDVGRLQSPLPGVVLERVAYRSLGDVPICGYLLRQDGASRRPLIVHTHGYNARYDVMVDWARRGNHVFGFDARGFGRSAGGLAVDGHGYVLTGIMSPRESILRGAVCDYIQASRTAAALLDGRVSRTVHTGFSFGGALALMASAVGDGTDMVVVGQPTFGWTSERRRLALGGSTAEINAYVEKYPWRLDAVTTTLEYFDTLHFAPLIGAPVLVGIGLDDDIVPSRTVLAVVNRMQCPLEVRLLPVSHSDDLRESLWYVFDEEWLELVESGPTPDFGVSERQVRVLGD